jgi:hypothetical protein
MRYVGHVTHTGGRRGSYRVLVGRREERGPLGRPRHRWVENIKMIIQAVGWKAMD